MTLYQCGLNQKKSRGFLQTYEAKKAADPEFYRGADSLLYGKDVKDSEEGIERMVAELTQQCVPSSRPWPASSSELFGCVLTRQLAFGLGYRLRCASWLLSVCQAGASHGRRHWRDTMQMHIFTVA